MPGITNLGIDDDFIPHCAAPTTEPWLRTEGRYWFFSGCAFTSYNHNAPPNDRVPSCGSWVIRDIGPGGLRGPRSYHPGSVNVLFGDGRVQSVKETIDAVAWRAMGTYDAGD